MKQKDRQSAQGLLPRMESRVWKDGKTVSYLHRTARGTLPDLHKNTATTARIYDRRKESNRGAM